MFQSLMENEHLPEGEKRYTNIYLRREMIVEFIKNKDVPVPICKRHVKVHLWFGG